MRAKELSSQPEANAAEARKGSDRVSNRETQAPLDSYAPRLDARPGGNPFPQSHPAGMSRLPHSQSAYSRNQILQLQRRYGNRYVQRILNLSRQGQENQAVTSDVEGAIDRTRGLGRSLDGGARAKMESAFGADFSGVHVHTDAGDDGLNRSLSAKAFTTGSDIYFRQGEYNPGSSSGRELLAHELTHVVQQNPDKVQPKADDEVSKMGSDCSNGAFGPQMKLTVSDQQDRLVANSSARPSQTLSLNSVSVAILQREDGDESNLDRLNEMLDSFDVPEEDVIDLCGQLTASEKATVLAGGYRSRMADALDIGEMVRAVDNLGPVLSTKLEWVNEAALMTSSIDYSDIGGMVRSAPQTERDELKINYWKSFFVDVCDNETMVEALNDLGYDLETKLTWLNAEMTVTSWELDYGTIKGWITAASQGERDALKTDAWQGFFVDVCDNETMVEALNDLGYDLETKLTWLNAEMTVTSWELDYGTIKPWITAASQGERDALKTETWQGFFVDVCDNETMVEAVIDLNFDLKTKIEWILAEGLGDAAIAHIVAQAPGDILTALNDLDEALLAQLRRKGDLIDALEGITTANEFARIAAILILITPAAVVDRVNARNEALLILTVQLNNKAIAKRTINSDTEVIIIPRNKLLTDVAQFAGLAGTSTFDGRRWETVRGTRSGDRVAMAEENLLGGNCTATFNGNPVSGAYTQGYSTASHEFAHGLHVNILDSGDRQIITDAYNARKALAVASPNDPDQWVDGREGCYASQNEREFFAQLSNAYLGTNTGSDTATGDPRHNGQNWVQTHEPTVFAVLDRMYGGGSIPNANP